MYVKTGWNPDQDHLGTDEQLQRHKARLGVHLESVLKRVKFQSS